MEKEKSQKNNPCEGAQFDTLTYEERQRIVGAFLWLLKEDKKQNPELYKPKKKS